jgi:hypothetical protein
MELAWGVVVLLAGLTGWLGQTFALLWPRTAGRLGITELESEVDPVFFADVRGEAAWDVLVLWTLPLAGLLLVLDVRSWAYFGLVGGGMYVYFAGRGIAQRVSMRRRGVRAGTPAGLRAVYVALAVWGVVAAITIALAADGLQAA